MVIRRIREASRRVFQSDWKARERALRIQEEIGEFQRIFRTNFVTLIISSFGLVAALTWNEVIKDTIATTVPTESHLVAKFYSAIVVTIISIMATYFLSKLKPPQ